MTDGFIKDNFTYEIIQYLGTISTRTDYKGIVWAKEVNIVSWNGRQPKLDIREWNKDHTDMTRGISLKPEEAEALLSILLERGEA